MCGYSRKSLLLWPALARTCVPKYAAPVCFLYSSACCKYIYTGIFHLKFSTGSISGSCQGVEEGSLTRTLRKSGDTKPIFSGLARQFLMSFPSRGPAGCHFVFSSPFTWGREPLELAGTGWNQPELVGTAPTLPHSPAGTILCSLGPSPEVGKHLEPAATSRNQWEQPLPPLTWPCWRHFVFSSPFPWGRELPELDGTGWNQPELAGTAPTSPHAALLAPFCVRQPLPLREGAPGTGWNEPEPAGTAPASPQPCWHPGTHRQLVQGSFWGGG